MAPPTTVRTIFPLNTAAIKQTTNGIVARSPNGNVWLPGKTTASKIVIGTKSNELDNTAGCPTDKVSPYRYLLRDLGNVFERIR